MFGVQSKQSPRSPRGATAGWALLICMWSTAALLGFAGLASYEFSPGAQGKAPQKWPTASKPRPDPEKPTVVMFAHPRCPCTRASLGELTKIATHAQGRATFLVYFFHPANAEADWSRTDLWDSAVAIPGARVAQDLDGATARCFQLKTSGHVLVYDRTGTLRYSGGVTASRGHHGDNLLAAAVSQVLEHGSSSLSEGAVFGCALSNAECRATPGSPNETPE